MNTPPPGSDTGLTPPVAGALAYVLAPLTGIAFLALERRDTFVRFHAAQSVVFGVATLAVWIALSIVSTIVSVVPILGAVVSFLAFTAVWVAVVIVWLFLLFQALSGREFELPVLGELARRLLTSPAVNS